MSNTKSDLPILAILRAHSLMLELAECIDIASRFPSLSVEEFLDGSSSHHEAVLFYNYDGSHFRIKITNVDYIESLLAGSLPDTEDSLDDGAVDD